MADTPDWRLAVDIGGTFTDFALRDADTGETEIWKVPTTSREPARAVLDGLRRVQTPVHFFVGAADRLGAPAAVRVALGSWLAAAFGWALLLSYPLWLGMSFVDMKDIPPLRAAFEAVLRRPLSLRTREVASLVEQVEIGVDAPDFPSALRAAMREELRREVTVAWIGHEQMGERPALCIEEARAPGRRVVG